MRVNQTELAEDKNKYTVMLAVPKHQEKKLQMKKATFFSLSFNMVIMIGIALILTVSVSSIQAAPADNDSTTVTTILPETNLTGENPTSAPVPVETTTEKRICHYRTPCGWAVYTPFTRRIEFFMRNICFCPEDKQCEHADDNLSVGAYVYRCNPKPPGQTPKPIGIPEV